MQNSKNSPRPFVKPKKSLGQHFLADDNIARKIVGLIDPTSKVLVEIGPGTGALTKFLVDLPIPLMLVEFDNEAVESLKTTFHGSELKIIHQSFLLWEVEAHLQFPACFIGNLPYNISSPVLFHLLENLNWVEQGIFMVQKEVAERICAKHGNKTYGILSVLLQTWFTVKYEFTVPETVFVPRPKVKSAVFSIRKKETLHPPEFSTFKKLVKAGFNQRRKTLRNALHAHSFSNPNEAEKFLTQRAEQLSIDEWAQLYRCL